ncbi:MAG: cupin domain-containing protein [Opitutales bacterium]|nr:cupin domain-containing protein [Opitutales bacterium]
MLIEFIKPDFEFSDARGSLAQLVHGGWNQVNYITSVAGAFRGDHYHAENREAFFVISGAFDLRLKRNKTGEEERYKIKAGDFFAINPGITHSFDYTADTSLISFYDKGVELPNGEKDILK